MSTDTQEPEQNTQSRTGPSRRAVLFLIVTAFLSTMGIGIVTPVLPFIVQQYISNQSDLASVVGWLASSYAICQFCAAPGLGLLSDRLGRRPLLMICLLGSALGYLLFGLGGALWILFISRIIDGLTGGNFSILTAYIADITQPEERSKFFGFFGAAAGVGFIIGPVIGGLAARLGPSAPLYIAAALTFANLLLGYFSLPESLRLEHRSTTSNLLDLNPFKQLGDIIAMPQLRWLLLLTFCYGLPFAVFTTNCTVLIKDSLGWQADAIGLIFLAIGGVDIFTQGILFGRLLPIFGEVKLTLAGLFCEIAAYLLLAAIVFIPSAALLITGIVFFALGGGLAEPALRGLIANVIGPSDQGRVQGGSASIQSLAQILGPLLGGLIYEAYGHATPYWLGCIVIGIAILAVFLARPSIKTRQGELTRLKA